MGKSKIVAIFFIYFFLLIYLSARFNFFKTWFYVFIWWGYILIFDFYFYKIKYSSIIFGKKFEILKVIIYSTFIWNIFEILNVRVSNWNYYNLPQNIWSRWTGYFLGFSTVLPGIYISTEIMSYILSEKKILKFDYCKFFLNRKSLSFISGILFLILPVIYPKYFFPLIWLFAIFLLLPFYLKHNVELFYFLKGMEICEKFNLLMMGGLFAGFLWELWNSFALSKWKYHIPFFSSPKIFEMPLPGFGGFMPFSIEVYLLYLFLSSIENRMKLKWKVLFFIFILFEIFFTFSLIDRFTLVKCQG